MIQNSEFKKTEDQKKAIKLLGSGAKNVMVYGGSRSGKSFIIMYALIVRMCMAKSRHVVLRQKFNHVKTSIWHETLPKVLKLCFPNLPVKWNKTDYFIEGPNESELWVAGLDNKERTEKILGKEYSTIFFNECSQLDLSAINIAKTRLAERNSLRKLCIYDQNPPSKRHWAYHLFERHFDPVAEDIVDPNDYASIIMNPHGNIANIDPDYIKMLEKLPEKERDRFLYGKYTDAEDGQVYYNFSQEECVDQFEVPRGPNYIGIDFNVDPFCAMIAKIADNKIYVFDEVFLRNSDTFKMSKEIKSKVTGQVYLAPDSTGKNRKTSGKSDFHILQECFGSNAILATRNPYVTDRVNNLNRLFAEGRIIIHPRCKKLINDLEKVFWKGNELDQKTDPLLTHISDGLGYLAWHLFPHTEIFDSEIRIY